MKNNFHFLAVLLLFSISTFAQTPEKISYQAIIRSTNNELVVNSEISLKIILRQNSPSGIVIYSEDHSVTTNDNGLISLEIGTGNVTQGNFNTIAWENGTYFIENQVDTSGGSNYSTIGVTQLLSVPYALHSKTAETLTTPIEPSRANIITLTNNRNALSTDINNTIACTNSANLNIPSNFSSMEIGDTINLEAHNGATLTVTASSGVILNYNASGIAEFISSTGNVRFGLLRKSDVNSYIISGQ